LKEPEVFPQLREGHHNRPDCVFCS
jgi:hypothetical protein